MSWFKKLWDNRFWRNLIYALACILVVVVTAHFFLKAFTRHGQHKAVPEFIGMNLTEVERIAGKESLRIEVMDSLYVPAFEGGTVLDQTPSPGASVKEGRRIFVTVNAYNQRKVRVPYVTGYSLRQAKNNLEVAGLTIDKIIYQSDMATNYVLEQMYKGRVIGASTNLEIEAGSGITLIVGMGSDAGPVQVPKVVGFPVNEASSRLWELGLNVNKIEYDKDVTAMNRHEARVYRQVPGAASSVSLGSGVTIYLTLDKDKVASGDKSSNQQAQQIMKELESRQAEEVVEAEDE